MSQTCLFTGATVQRGGYVARELLSQAHKVNASVRDPSLLPLLRSSKQQARPSSKATSRTILLRWKTQHSDAQAFSYTSHSPFKTPGAELQHAQNVITACQRAGVTKLVYSSVARAGEHESFPAWNPESVLAGYWLSKHRCQEAVKAARGSFRSWTIIQPGWLMSNLLPPTSRFYFPELASQGGPLRTASRPETKLQVWIRWMWGDLRRRRLLIRWGCLTGV